MMEVFRINTAQRGFTLVELLVAMAIVGIVTAAIHSAYVSQSLTFTAQEQVVAMQQNLRAGMYFMERELRMAGYNPAYWNPANHATDGVDNDCDGLTDAADTNGEDVGPLGIREATASTLRIVRDQNGDKDSCDAGADFIEDVTYSLAGGNLVRINNLTSPAFSEPIAEHIQSLDFVYLDGAGTPFAFPLSAADRANVRSVQITLVARTAQADKGFSGTASFQNLQGTTIYTVPAPGDGFRRQALSVQVNCRNLGV